MINLQFTMTLEEAIEHKNKLNDSVDKYSKELNSFDQKNSIGLVIEELRFSQEYKEIENNYNKAFKELREFNSWFVKTYKGMGRKKRC